MVELQIEHTVETTRIRAKEMPLSEMATIRSLVPENPEDFTLAKSLDEASLEARNPFSDDHTPMMDDELRIWAKGDRDHSLIVFFPKDVKDPSGFVYLYPDEPKRLAEIRRRMYDLPDDAQVTELNFWNYENADEDIVVSGIRQTLDQYFADDTHVSEQGKRVVREKYAVMYVDPEDTADIFQLLSVGGEYAGDINYDIPESKDGPRDLVFVIAKEDFIRAKNFFLQLQPQ